MFSGFQLSGYQHSGYQIVDTGNNGWLGGGYVSPYQQYKIEEHKRKKLARQRAELKRIDDAIAEAERLALARREAREMAASQAAYLEEINRLRMERAWLMRRMDDEEAILVLLLAMPLH